MNQKQYDDMINSIYDRVSNKPSHTPFFQTMRMKPLTMKTDETYIQKCFEINQAFYKNLCAKLIRNYTRKSKHYLQPITYDFIDVAGSKSHKIYNIDTMPHIHSIVLVPKQLAERYLQLSNFQLKQHIQQSKLRNNQHSQSNSFTATLSCIESIDTKAIRSCDLRKVISYASKLLQHPVSDRLSLMNMLPDIPQSSTRNCIAANTIPVPHLSTFSMTTEISLS